MSELSSWTAEDAQGELAKLPPVVKDDQVDHFQIPFTQATEKGRGRHPFSRAQKLVNKNHSTEDSAEISIKGSARLQGGDPSTLTRSLKANQIPRDPTVSAGSAGPQDERCTTPA